MPDENSGSNSVEVKAEGEEDKSAEEDKPKFKFTVISVAKNDIKDYKSKIMDSNTQFKELVYWISFVKLIY